jgi:hypothetical protein
MALLASRPVLVKATHLARPLVAARPRVLTVRNFAQGPAPTEEAKQDTTQVSKPQQAAQAPAVQPSSSPARLANIFHEMEREMNALTRGFFGSDMFMDPFFRTGGNLPSMRMPAAPSMASLPAMRLATDVTEDDKAYTIKADVPGM